MEETEAERTLTRIWGGLRELTALLTSESIRAEEGTLEPEDEKQIAALAKAFDEPISKALDQLVTRAVWQRFGVRFFEELYAIYLDRDDSEKVATRIASLLRSCVLFELMATRRVTAPGAHHDSGLFARWIHELTPDDDTVRTMRGPKETAFHFVQKFLLLYAPENFAKGRDSLLRRLAKKSQADRSPSGAESVRRQLVFTHLLNVPEERQTEAVAWLNAAVPVPSQGSRSKVERTAFNTLARVPADAATTTRIDNAIAFLSGDDPNWMHPVTEDQVAHVFRLAEFELGHVRQTDDLDLRQRIFDECAPWQRDLPSG